MKLMRVRAVARKEFLHIIRDPLSLALAIGLPVLLLILFGFALTLDVDHVPMVVWDQSRTALSREFISRFAGSRYFSIQSYVTDYRQIEYAIDSRQALMAMVIPTQFERQVESESQARVQMIIDGTNANTATLAMGYAEAVVSTFSKNVAIDRFQRLAGFTLEPPLEVRPRVWFNEDLKSRNFIFPGLIAVIMMIIAAMQTSLTVAREWEQGTMEQLISTPVKGPELIVGKLLPYIAVGMLDVVLAVLMGEFVFHVPFRGSVILMLSLSAIFLVGVLSLGILLSVITKTQVLASQLTMLLTFVPSFLLSGFVFPISNMPPVIQAITYVVPARYYIAMLKGIYLKGVGLRVMYIEAGFMILFGVLMVVLAVVKFKKKLE
jgi:ABC-2 type transport system permease protein